MYRDFFTNKWCLGYIGFLLVVCIGCYLWYQHVTVPYRQQAIDTSEEVAISQYGFGPYPKIPEGMSFIPWERIVSADHELMQRVCIKLWEEGIHSDGAVMENGLVFPTVRGRVYIKGGNILSHPDDNLQLIRGRLPDLSDFDVYSYDEGIEPYSYLNVERQK